MSYQQNSRATTPVSKVINLFSQFEFHSLPQKLQLITGSASSGSPNAVIRRADPRVPTDLSNPGETTDEGAAGSNRHPPTRLQPAHPPAWTCVNNAGLGRADTLRPSEIRGTPQYPDPHTHQYGMPPHRVQLPFFDITDRYVKLFGEATA